MSHISYQPTLVISETTGDMRMILASTYIPSTGSKKKSRRSAKRLKKTENDRECTLSSVAKYSTSELIANDFEAMLTYWKKGVETDKKDLRDEVMLRIIAELSDLKEEWPKRMNNLRMIEVSVNDLDAGRISQAFLTLRGLSFLGHKSDELSALEQSIDGTFKILEWMESRTQSVEVTGKLEAHREWMEEHCDKLAEMREALDPLLQGDTKPALDMIKSWEWNSLHIHLGALTRAVRSGRINGDVLEDFKKLDEFGIQGAMSDWDGYCNRVLGVETLEDMSPDLNLENSQVDPSTVSSRSRRQKDKSKVRERANAASRKSMWSRRQWDKTPYDWRLPSQAFVNLSSANRGLTLEALGKSVNSYAILQPLDSE